ncbi:C39 family peptidase, partial [Candidatus Parcubacteria bacterium]|nr:C39 family peptidase [Candidatus Parcubacteria bacterium]
MKLRILSLLLVVMVFFVSSIEAKSETVRVQLPPWIEKHGDWRKYQMEPLSSWQSYLAVVNKDKAEKDKFHNNNCGPATTAMILYYYLNINLSTAYNSSPLNAQKIDCRTEARWKYCRANGVSDGYYNAYYTVTGSDIMTSVLERNGLDVGYVAGKKEVTLNRIKSEINSGNLVICHVNAREYGKSSYAPSHWIIAFGYDDNNIIINDPGYSDYANKLIPNDKFYNALYYANSTVGGGEMILMPVSSSKYQVVQFDGENAIHLYNHKILWPINGGIDYNRLGFGSFDAQCTDVGSTSKEPNWDFVIKVPMSRKARYADKQLIGRPAFPTQGSLVRIVDKVGPTTCLSRDANKYVNTLYIFDCDKFRPINTWDTCTNLGYDANDIVDITQELFNEYGMGYMIYNTENLFCKSPGYGGGDSGHESYDECFGNGYHNLFIESTSSTVTLSVSQTSDICTCLKAEILQYVNGIDNTDGIRPKYDYLNNCTEGDLTITGLNPDTEYYFQVNLYANEGLGEGDERVSHTSRVCVATKKEEIPEPISEPEPEPTPDPDPEPIPEELPTCNCSSFSLNKTGGETRIDNLIQFDRANGEIATLANGKTIITFFEDYDIYFTIINENGNIVKSRTRANTFTDYTQDNPSIILVGDNNFAIVWHSYKGDGDGYAIMLKIFNDNGDEILGETLINQSTASSQKTPFGSPLENGDFFVFWQSYEDGFGIEDGAGGQSYDIFGRKLSSTGEFLTNEFIVNQERINHQEEGQSVLLENGNTIIVWQSRSTHEEYDNCKGNVFFRVINQGGNFLNNEVQVNTNNVGCQKHPTITALPESEFAIAWQSNHEYSNSYDIMLQYFNNQFQKNSDEIEFSSLSRSQTYPSITSTPNGCIIGTWNDDYIDNNGRAVVARAINCNHEFYRTEVQINDYKFADQLKPKVSITPNNNVIIIWQGKNPETIGTSNTDNIYMQGFGITLNGYEEIPVS